MRKLSDECDFSLRDSVPELQDRVRGESHTRHEPVQRGSARGVQGVCTARTSRVRQGHRGRCVQVSSNPVPEKVSEWGGSIQILGVSYLAQRVSGFFNVPTLKLSKV